MKIFIDNNLFKLSIFDSILAILLVILRGYQNFIGNLLEASCFWIELWSLDEL